MISLYKFDSTYTRLHNSIKAELFSIPLFDAETEHLFWRERQAEFHKTLKTALLLGLAVFLTFIGIKVFNHHLSAAALSGRLLIVLALAGLFALLHFQRQAIERIRTFAKLAVTASSLHIVSSLLIDANPSDYTESWTGFLAIYFFTYGQMYLSRNEALAFGWLSMTAVTLSGYRVGVALPELTPSILILLLVNSFGYCTRCQLEAYSRNAFRDRRQAENAATDKTFYLCQLSHNLRQIVQTISCYSSVLDNEIARVNCHELLNTSTKLGNAVDELNNAFNHILDLAHLETGKQAPQLTFVDINVLLDALEMQFAPLAAKRGLRLKILRRGRPPYTVHTDANILKQILANLIDNAIKYTAKGWILVAGIKINGTQLKLHVRDSGAGISEEVRESIFKEFYRGGRRHGDADVYGLGIGLAYVLKATQHLPEHCLNYHSRLNRGSDFTITLPVGQLKTANNTVTGRHYDLAGCFVLAVDDDDTVLKALSEQLRSWGCIVQNAASTAETLSCLAETIRPPDLVITDFYLENQETAHDIIAAIQADSGPVPTLILSAHAIPETDKAKWPDNTLLLRKPANAAILLEAIAKAMGKSTCI